MLCLSFSIASVLLIVLVITTSVQITLLVALCVALTDFFLMGLIFYWNLALNQIVILNVILAVGTSVDYSTHIAYAYLTTEAPKHCTTIDQKRAFKAKMAL